GRRGGTGGAVVVDPVGFGHGGGGKRGERGQVDGGQGGGDRGGRRRRRRDCRLGAGGRKLAGLGARVALLNQPGQVSAQQDRGGHRRRAGVAPGAARGFGSSPAARRDQAGRTPPAAGCGWL